MDVILRCRDCDRFTRVPADGRDFPPCKFCGGVEFAIASLAGSERVERANDEDGWKNSYDDWKTGGGGYH